MKNSPIVLMASFTFIFTFNSCKKGGVDNPELTGQWQLKYSVGGIGGSTIKPDKKVILIFNRDSTYALKEDGTITSNGDYHVTYDTTYGNIFFLEAIRIDFLPGPSGEIYTIKNNQLILTDCFISDGYTHCFERIK